MNRSQIRDLVIEATRRTDKVSLINSAINIALGEFSSEHPWSDLVVEDDLTLTADTSSVDMPLDVSRVAEVRIIDPDTPTFSYTLEIRPKTWLTQRFPNASGQSSVSRPTFGYLENRKLFVVPLANRELTVRLTYCRLHPEFTSDADELLVLKGGPIVAAYATYWTFLSIEKAQDAANWLNTYGGLLARAKKLDLADSAIRFVADQRGQNLGTGINPWEDPFNMGEAN